MRIGYIRDISFTDSADPTKGVTFTARIDRKIRLPGNANAYIFTKGFVGSAYIEIKAAGPARTDPRTGKPLDFFPTDGSIPLTVAHLGSGLIPDEMMTALDDLRSGFKDLGALARNLNELLAPPASATAPAEGNAPTTATAPAGPDVRSMLAKLGKTLDGLSVMVGDTENQANLKTSLANLAKVSAQGAEVMEALKGTLAQAMGTLEKADSAIQTTTQIVEKAGGSFDRLSAKLMDDADKLAVLMTGLTKIVGKLETSEGTAGKLINDPKLYNNLLEITGQLTGLMKEFKVLVESWEKSGVGIKLR
jgi:ABC-type transporter Mla subunit MlaD